MTKIANQATCRPVVLSANLNVFSHPELNPITNEVRSWAWRHPGLDEESAKWQLLRQTTHELRRFENGVAVAHNYVQPKRFFASDASGFLLAAIWITRSVWRSKRVLIGVPQASRDGALSLLMLICAVVARRPTYLYSEHWLLPAGPRNILRRAAFRVVGRFASRVVVPAVPHEQMAMAIGVSRERIDVIGSIYSPTPPVEQLLRRRGERVGRRWTVLYVGRIIPLKGLDRLISAMSRLVDLGMDVELRVVESGGDQWPGADETYRLRCLAHAAAWLGRDRFALDRELPDLTSAFRLADVLAMPNRILCRDRVPAESWGRVVEEALGAGCPVVATDAVPSARSLVKNGVNGFVVNWQHDTDLLEALIAVLCPGRLNDYSPGRGGLWTVRR